MHGTNIKHLRKLLSILHPSVLTTIHLIVNYIPYISVPVDYVQGNLYKMKINYMVTIDTVKEIYIAI
jgi:hypothetical protein